MTNGQCHAMSTLFGVTAERAYDKLRERLFFAIDELIHVQSLVIGLIPRSLT